MLNSRRTRRWILSALAVFAVAGVAWSDEPASGEATPATPSAEAPSAAVRREIEKIQQSLGGSIVNQFPALAPAADQAKAPPAVNLPLPVAGPPSPWPAKAPLSIDQPTPFSAAPLSGFVRLRPNVVVLRTVATELDAVADRLEQAELYRQADAVRAQAQRLRVDARGLQSPQSERPAPENGEVLDAPAWQLTPEPQEQEPQKPRRLGYSTRGRPRHPPPPSTGPY